MFRLSVLTFYAPRRSGCAIYLVGLALGIWMYELAQSDVRKRGGSLRELIQIDSDAGRMIIPHVESVSSRLVNRPNSTLSCSRKHNSFRVVHVRSARLEWRKTADNQGKPLQNIHSH